MNQEPYHFSRPDISIPANQPINGRTQLSNSEIEEICRDPFVNEVAAEESRPRTIQQIDIDLKSILAKLESSSGRLEGNRSNASTNRPELPVGKIIRPQAGKSFETTIPLSHRTTSSEPKQIQLSENRVPKSHNITASNLYFKSELIETYQCATPSPADFSIPVEVVGHQIAQPAHSEIVSAPMNTNLGTENLTEIPQSSELHPTRLDPPPSSSAQVPSNKSTPSESSDSQAEIDQYVDRREFLDASHAAVDAVGGSFGFDPVLIAPNDLTPNGRDTIEQQANLPDSIDTTNSISGAGSLHYVRNSSLTPSANGGSVSPSESQGRLPSTQVSQSPPNHDPNRVPTQTSSDSRAPEPNTDDTQPFEPEGEDVFIAKQNDVIEIDGSDGYDHIDLSCFERKSARIEKGRIVIDDGKDSRFEVRYQGIDYAVFARNIRVELNS
ncbi:MAG: hypothetical protein AAF623_15685 [Planctomycetota bacterium]